MKYLKTIGILMVAGIFITPHLFADENTVARQSVESSLETEMRNLSLKLKNASKEQTSLNETIESAAKDLKKNNDPNINGKCLEGLLGWSDLSKKYALGSAKQLVSLNVDGQEKGDTEIIQPDGRITSVSINGSCNTKKPSPGQGMRDIVISMASSTYSKALKLKFDSTAPAVLATCLASESEVLRQATREGMYGRISSAPYGTGGIAPATTR